MNVSETIDKHIDQVLVDTGFKRAQKYPIDTGFKRVQQYVYKAPWSTQEIGHFVYLGEGLKRTDVLVGNFGIRNDLAEIFSCNAIHTYGGELFKSFKCAEPASCMIRFDFSRIEPARWPMLVSSLSESEVGECVRDFIRERLIPTVGQTTTLGKFLSLLTSDTSCCPWLASNGAIRAAQIAALAGQIGLGADHVRGLLEPRKSLIAHGVSKTSEMRANPTAYVDRILDDWAAGRLRSI
jgi:hypothetical protein